MPIKASVSLLVGECSMVFWSTLTLERGALALSLG
jgi:hypothetical protein